MDYSRCRLGIDRQTGKPGKFVIGCQRPSSRSYWKTQLLNRGESPVKAEDPEVAPYDRALRPREENARVVACLPPGDMQTRLFPLRALPTPGLGDHITSNPVAGSSSLMMPRRAATAWTLFGRVA